MKERPSFHEEEILIWADAHYKRTGAWPTTDSGPIPGTSTATSWSAISPMKTLVVFLVGIGVLIFLVGIVLTIVQADQVLRTHAALMRLREEISELENIGAEQRNGLEARRLVD